jgi:rhodanese-related sulfurtransferase
MTKTLKELVQEARQHVPEVSAEEALEMLERDDVLVLDVRDPDEYREGCLPSAVNVSRGRLETIAGDKPLDEPAKTILCYCGGGTRSLLAGKTLNEMGFENVVSMSGGWRGWAEKNLPQGDKTSFDPGS